MSEEIRKDVIIGIKTDTGDAQKDIKDLKDDLTDLGNKPIDKPFLSLRTQIKAATAEAQKMRREFGQNSTQFDQAAQKVAVLKEEFKKTNETIRAFNPANKLQALVGVASGAVGAIQGVTGAMAFLGLESESSLETIKKLQGLMAFSQALNSIAEIKNSFKSLAQVIITASQSMGLVKVAQEGAAVAAIAEAGAQQVQTGAIIETEVAADSLFKTLLKNPLFLIIAGVVALGTALYLLTKNTKEQTLAHKQLNEVYITASESSVKQKVSLDLLYKSASDVTRSTKDRLASVEELQKKFPGYFEDIKTEKDLHDKLAAAYDKTTEGIINQAKAEAIYNQIVKNETDILDERRKSKEAFIKLDQAKATGDSFLISLYELAANKAVKKIGELTIASKTLVNTLSTNGPTTDDAAAAAKLKEEKDRKDKEDANKAAQTEKERKAKIAALRKERDDKDNQIQEESLSTAQKKLLELRRKYQELTDALEKDHQKLSKDDIEKYNKDVKRLRKDLGDEEADALLAQWEKEEKDDKEHQKKILDDAVLALGAKQAALTDQLLKGSITQKQFDDQTLANEIASDQTLLDSKQLSADKIVEIQTRLNGELKKQRDTKEADALQAINDAQIKEDDATKQRVADHKITQNQADLEELEALATKLEQELALRKAAGEDVTAQESALAAARIAIHSKEHDIRSQQLNEIADLSTKLGDIVGKQTVAGKALGIATALINTYQGVSEAIKQKSSLPSPFDIAAKVINVAYILKTGLDTVKAITAVKVPGGSGEGSGGTASGLTLGNAPTINSSQLNPTVAAQVQDVRVTNGQDQIVKTYVSLTDLRTNEQKEKFFNNLTTF